MEHIIYIAIIIFLIILLIRKSTKKSEGKIISHGTDFSIEYYPLNNFYYAKYKNWYLKTDYYTGIVGVRDGMMFADQFKTFDSAKNAIEKYKETSIKENMITTVI